MRYVLLIHISLMFMCSCRQPSAPTMPVISRDTTIQPSNAFTKLNLDSNAVVDFLSRNSVEDPLRSKLIGFYNVRNYQYAWFTEDGLSEAGQAFWSLSQHQPVAIDDSSYLYTAMARLLDEEAMQPAADSIQQIELNLTLHFFRYVKTAFGATVEPSDMQWHIPRRKLNAAALLDTFLSGNGKTLQPLNSSFYSLQKKVKLLADAVKSGGWPLITLETKTLKKGQSNDAVITLKKRLSASGDLPAGDTGRLFTNALAQAVRRTERSFGLKEDGLVTKELVDELNVPAGDRMQQLLINLERMRWLPAWPANRIVANIPEYRLHVFENEKQVLAMNIVVGKAANRTVIFSDELEYVVFSPYWNIPKSIVRNEIVPAMNRSSNYISRNNMEITGYSNGLPVVRQKPGAGNALGRVKFIFPNRYNIYFHDTPSKTLFSRQSRAFSHGCIRVQEPFALAQYLLQSESSWTDAKIRKAMNSRHEKWVKLPASVPVYLLYLTAWVDDQGLLNFRDDIYGHDSRMAKRLFTDEKEIFY